MALSELDLEHDDEYKSLIEAVVKAAKVDYIKLAHPARRNKKYLIHDYQTSIDMFFDENFTFENFTSYESQENLSLKELLIIMLGSSSVSLDKTKQHILDETIKYWWTKNFHDLKVPNHINILGKVYSVHNASTEYIDFEKNKLYFNLKKQNNDRIFIKLCLKIILKESNIELSDVDFQNLYKVIYLFLKINGAFQHY